MFPNWWGKAAAMFFGKFIDGPMAGASFELHEAHGGGGGGFTALVGIGVVIAFGIFAVAAPVLMWPLLFQEALEPDGRNLALLAVPVAEVGWMAWRMLRGVRRGGVSFVSELLLNVAFLFMCFVFLFVAALIWVIAFYDGPELDPELRAFLAAHVPELMAQVGANIAAGLVTWLFVLAALSALPAALVCGLSSWLATRADESGTVCEKGARAGAFGCASEQGQRGASGERAGVRWDQAGMPRDWMGAPQNQAGVPWDRTGTPQNQAGVPRDWTDAPWSQTGSPRDRV